MSTSLKKKNNSVIKLQGVHWPTHTTSKGCTNWTHLPTYKPVSACYIIDTMTNLKWAFKSVTFLWYHNGIINLPVSDYKINRACDSFYYLQLLSWPYSSGCEQTVENEIANLLLWLVWSTECHRWTLKLMWLKENFPNLCCKTSKRPI